MRRLALRAVPVLLAALAASGAHADSGADRERTRLLGDLSAEALAVRERASERLESMDDLPAAEVAEALRTASPRARPLLLRLAALRGMRELAPLAAEAAVGADAQAAEAAIRALVAMGPDAVAAGRKALDAAASDPASERERAARRRHLDALDAQHRVEHEVLARWRRKGGSYRGRYADLASLGWEAQPVLLAMLLDVPLEDQHVVVPPSGDENLDRLRRAAALDAISNSRRRGYRTFEPLPSTIEQEELFDLAQQALADVADLDLMQHVLEETQRSLKRAHDAAPWRPRPWEDQFAQEIEVILAARGAPGRLDERRRMLQAQVDTLRRRISRMDPDDAADEFQFYSVRLGDLAGVLHQLGRFDEAAERYGEVVEIVRRLTGKEPSISGYNRACALARGGRRDDAFDQLARALDPNVSSGSEDLTREWVTEDGDLQSLHSDPRFASILRRRFGP